MILPAALQERFDMEQQRQPVAEGNQSAAMETAGANGVSDATGKGEEPTSEGANERLEQVTKYFLGNISNFLKPGLIFWQ